VTLPRALGYAALFSLYAYVWLPVGWRATWRLLRRRRGWTKTLRLAPPIPPAAPATARTDAPESRYAARS
jgi:hypothetical protein